MSESTKRGGRSVVLFLYVGIVLFAGGVGYLLSTIGVATRAVHYLGIVRFPPTPVGLALFGSLTLATVLGLPLLLVAFISRRADAERAG